MASSPGIQGVYSGDEDEFRVPDPEDLADQIDLQFAQDLGEMNLREEDLGFLFDRGADTGTDTGSASGTANRQRSFDMIGTIGDDISLDSASSSSSEEEQQAGDDDDDDDGGIPLGKQAASSSSEEEEQEAAPAPRRKRKRSKKSKKGKRKRKGKGKRQRKSSGKRHQWRPEKKVKNVEDFTLDHLLELPDIEVGEDNQLYVTAVPIDPGKNIAFDPLVGGPPYPQLDLDSNFAKGKEVRMANRAVLLLSGQNSANYRENQRIQLDSDTLIQDEFQKNPQFPPGEIFRLSMRRKLAWILTAVGDIDDFEENGGASEFTTCDTKEKDYGKKLKAQELRRKGKKFTAEPLYMGRAYGADTGMSDLPTTIVVPPCEENKGTDDNPDIEFAKLTESQKKLFLYNRLIFHPPSSFERYFDSSSTGTPNLDLGNRMLGLINDLYQRPRTRVWDPKKKGTNPLTYVKPISALLHNAMEEHLQAFRQWCNVNGLAGEYDKIHEIQAINELRQLSSNPRTERVKPSGKGFLIHIQHVDTLSAILFFFMLPVLQPPIEDREVKTAIEKGYAPGYLYSSALTRDLHWCDVVLYSVPGWRRELYQTYAHHRQGYWKAVTLPKVLRTWKENFQPLFSDPCCACILIPEVFHWHNNPKKPFLTQASLSVIPSIVVRQLKLDGTGPVNKRIKFSFTQMHPSVLEDVGQSDASVGPMQAYSFRKGTTVPGFSKPTPDTIKLAKEYEQTLEATYGNRPERQWVGTKADWVEKQKPVMQKRQKPQSKYGFGEPLDEGEGLFGDYDPDDVPAGDASQGPQRRLSTNEAFQELEDDISFSASESEQGAMLLSAMSRPMQNLYVPSEDEEESSSSSSSDLDDAADILRGMNYDDESSSDSDSDAPPTKRQREEFGRMLMKAQARLASAVKSGVQQGGSGSMSTQAIVPMPLDPTILGLSTKGNHGSRELYDDDNMTVVLHRFKKGAKSKYMTLDTMQLIIPISGTNGLVEIADSMDSGVLSSKTKTAYVVHKGVKHRIVNNSKALFDSTLVVLTITPKVAPQPSSQAKIKAALMLANGDRVKAASILSQLM